MNKLTGEIRSLLRPRAALIAYSGENATDGDYFLELREIDPGGRMREAIPVTYEFMNAIASNYSETRSGTPHGAVPANLLYCDTRRGGERYVWYDTPRKRMMYFKKDLCIDSGEYHMPGIIYSAMESGLSVYAYKDGKLTEESKLYAAPFFNVTNANVCLGSAKLQKPADPSFRRLMDYWEKKFWLTEFSHLGGVGNPTRNNLVLVTKQSAGRPFDTSELISINMKLKDILK